VWGSERIAPDIPNLGTMWTPSVSRLGTAVIPSRKEPMVPLERMLGENSVFTISEICFEAVR
jgi:hypothetical protein